MIFMEDFLGTFFHRNEEKIIGAKIGKKNPAAQKKIRKKSILLKPTLTNLSRNRCMFVANLGAFIVLLLWWAR